MEIEVRFYTRHDFPGWRQLAWLPVRWLQGEFVHTDIYIPSMQALFNAHTSFGVGLFEPSDISPSRTYSIPVDKIVFEDYVDHMLGRTYSWSSYLWLLLPRWGRNPDGFICSELVADALQQACKHPLLKAVVTAVPPYRWTPNMLLEVFENLDIQPDKIVSKTKS